MCENIISQKMLQLKSQLENGGYKKQNLWFCTSLL